MPNGENVEYTRPNEKWLPNITAIKEPILGRESFYVPWEPTPADLRHGDVKEHQIAVREQVAHIFDELLPSLLDESTGEPIYDARMLNYIELQYHKRESTRSLKNSKGFYNRLVPKSFDARSKELGYKVGTGTARPAESLQAMDLFKASGGELARLMHIAGFRMEYLQPMRNDIEQSIRDLGGELIENPIPEYDFITYRGENIGNLEYAVPMKRKRKLGSYHGIDVYERSSFIVRLDEHSSISPEVIEGIARIDTSNKNIVDGKEIWKLQALEGTNLVNEVISLLQVDDTETIIPLSTTTYGVNETVRAELKPSTMGRRRDPEYFYEARQEYAQHGDILKLAQKGLGGLTNFKRDMGIKDVE